MSNSSLAVVDREACWVRFWHAPVRAERLALSRILLATALLTDELVQFLPNLAEFFGPNGVGYAGLYDDYQLQRWRIVYLLFNTDNMAVIYPVFGLWVIVTVAFLIGWQTRWMNLLLWLLTRCFLERHPNIIYGADDVLQIGLFLLLLAPSGAALSVDAWWRRRRGLLVGPAWVPPWSLRLLQIQLCLIYCSAGFIKLKGTNWADGWWTSWPPEGSWWDGTAIHYFLNDTSMSRRAFAEYPLPFWLTRVMTWLTVAWEASFPLLVLNRTSRRFALLFGILFHIGVTLTVDIGWFSYYTLSLYGVWTSDEFWRRFDKNAISVFSWLRRR